MKILKNFLNKKNLNKYQVYASQVNKLANDYAKKIKPEDIANELLVIKDNKKMKVIDKTMRAMALAKNAAQHVLGMTYYDVQIMGALALTDGEIAEMKTGEGKTLTCSAAVASNFVQGFKTHVVTANEYLAVRDRQTLASLYNFMGITNAHNISTMNKEEKRNAYQCEVVYSVATELGFDYLRDNLVYDIKDKTQQIDFENTKALIDEADFILIDEARTPMIISSPSSDNLHDKYSQIIDIIKNLQKMAKEPSTSPLDMDEKVPGDFWLDEKTKSSYLSEDGFISVENQAISHNLIKKSEELYLSENSWIIREIRNAINAKYLYLLDRDYIVRNGEVIIIDANTGRLSEGRSWSEGLSQAIQAKENIEIKAENASSGTISVQNYFRLYCQISGMSGTIMTSSEEFEFIYNSHTIAIPKNRPNRRKDHDDRLFITMDSKYQDIVKEIKKRISKGQPILLGTVSVRESEHIGELLTKAQIPHYVLNAKNHLQEAQIIAQAGVPGIVTVATSMAGRGTDIILGGNQEVFQQLISEQLNEIKERREFLSLRHNEISQFIKIQQEELEKKQASIESEKKLEQEKILIEIHEKNNSLKVETQQLLENMENQKTRANNFSQKWNSPGYAKQNFVSKIERDTSNLINTADEVLKKTLPFVRPSFNPDLLSGIEMPSEDSREVLRRKILEDSFEMRKLTLDKVDIGQNKIQINLSQFNMEITDDNFVTDEYFEYISINEKILMLYHPLVISSLLHNGPDYFNRQIQMIENTIIKQRELVDKNITKWKEEVLAAGGLCVIGCSRSESRRIDNQLIGRSGRQGDQGESIFFLSLEDEWIRVYVEGKMFQVLRKMIGSEGFLEGKSLSSSFEKTQNKREEQSYAGRKNTFQYDSAADDARKSFIHIRDSILKEPNSIKEYLKNSMFNKLKPIAHNHFFSHLEDKLKIENTNTSEIINSVFLMPYQGLVDYAKIYMEDEENHYLVNIIDNNQEMSYEIIERINNKISEIISELNDDEINQLAVISLQSFDKLWSDMLTSLDEIRQNVALRQIAQKNPLYEFKTMCFDYFSALIENFQAVIIDNYFNILDIKHNQIILEAQRDNEFISIDSFNTVTEGIMYDDSIELSSYSHEELEEKN